MSKDITMNCRFGPTFDTSALANALEKCMTESKKEGRPVYGTLEHPEDMYISDSFHPQLKEIACEINDMKIENINIPSIKIDANILDTQKGKILQELINNNINIRFAPSVLRHSDGTYEVVNIGIFPEKSTKQLIHERVLHFINKFKNEGNIQIFTEGCCYWFAVILQERFKLDKYDTEIMYNQADGHFACRINGILYDINGEIADTENWELWSECFANETARRNIVLRDCIYKDEILEENISGNF